MDAIGVVMFMFALGFVGSLCGEITAENKFLHNCQTHKMTIIKDKVIQCEVKS